jgi:hypothetical protein
MLLVCAGVVLSFWLEWCDEVVIGDIGGVNDEVGKGVNVGEDLWQCVTVCDSKLACDCELFLAEWRRRIRVEILKHRK